MFFKIQVIDRPTHPFGKIIALTEGELGLLNKELYRREPSKRAIDVYKELLQNVIRLFDSLSDHYQARQFADTIYNYEKRLVNDALYYSEGDSFEGGVVKMGQIKMELPTIAVYETIKAVFPKLRISDNTEIWIDDYEMLKAVSRVVSTTDAA